jgi:hypothetical protein
MCTARRTCSCCGGTSGLKSVYAALWWVPAGHIPGVDEAKKRLAHLAAHGPTEFAFTFQNVFQPDEGFQQAIDWSSFRPCPAM